MEPPSKRRRLSGNNCQNDIHAQRAQNDFRLKSIFESIFEKYDRDFGGIGDEIDMETGEIVVNNGHIMGMTNERDIGNAKYSSKKLGDSDCEDEQLSIDFDAELLAGLGPSMVGDATAMEESEASEQLDFDADSLMGDVPADSHLNRFGNKSRRALSIPSDDEEDELASSDIERASCKKNRSSAQERFFPIEDDYAFLDKPAMDPVWRVPPLPNMKRKNKKEENVGLASIDVRDHSDDERAGISLWTPEVKTFPQRRYGNSRSINQRSSSFLYGQEAYAARRRSESSDSDFAPRKFAKWTQEEDELLRHLKTTTNLTSTTMEPYFPTRNGNTIASHWSYMISRGKASPKPQVSTALESRILLPRLSSRTRPLTLDGPCTDLHDHDTISKAQDPQTVQQQQDEEIQKAGNFVRYSTMATEHLRDHWNSQDQVSGDQGNPAVCAVDEFILDSDEVEAHTVYPRRDQLSRQGGRAHEVVKSAHQVASNEAYADADHSCSLSKPYGFGDDVSMGKIGKIKSSKVADRDLGRVSETDYRARVSIPTTSIKTKPDCKGAELNSDNIISHQIQSRITTAFQAPNWPKGNSASDSKIQLEETVRSAAEDVAQRYRQAAEVTRSRSTDLVSTTPALPSDPVISSASLKPGIEPSSKDLVSRQIVRVVIPQAARSNVMTTRIRSPSVTTETADPTFIRQLSATTESVFAAPCSSSPHQGNIAICTPTRLPSVAAAESQHAASAAFVLDNKNRSSLGPEIADSQPLSTTPTASTPVPEIGGDVTRPIILDADSPPLNMGPSVAPSARKQLKKVTNVIVPESVSQPSCVSIEPATPAWKQIEEAKESDVVESGAHSSSKTFLAAKSLSNRVKKKKTVAESFHPMRAAVDDHSEDELSYL